MLLKYKKITQAVHTLVAWKVHKKITMNFVFDRSKLKRRKLLRKYSDWQEKQCDAPQYNSNLSIRCLGISELRSSGLDFHFIQQSERDSCSKTLERVQVVRIAWKFIDIQNTRGFEANRRF